ncbi:hypothetical protein LINGRAHAP2_LOCUS14333 [Linum grandiflorum]
METVCITGRGRGNLPRLAGGDRIPLNRSRSTLMPSLMFSGILRILSRLCHIILGA